MAVKGKKLKQRIGRWQEYVEQPPVLPVAADGHTTTPEMFSWDLANQGEEVDVDAEALHYSVLPMRGADYVGGPLRQSTSLQTNAAAAEDRKRLEAFEHMLAELEVQLQSERRRAEQLQTQLANEVMRSRQVRMDQRTHSRKMHVSLGNRVGRMMEQVRAATASINSSSRFGNTVSRSRINSVQWIVIVALTAGISSLLIMLIGNGFAP